MSFPLNLFQRLEAAAIRLASLLLPSAARDDAALGPASAVPLSNLLRTDCPAFGRLVSAKGESLAIEF